MGWEPLFTALIKGTLPGGILPRFPSPFSFFKKKKKEKQEEDE